MFHSRWYDTCGVGLKCIVETLWFSSVPGSCRFDNENKKFIPNCSNADKRVVAKVKRRNIFISFRHHWNGIQCQISAGKVSLFCDSLDGILTSCLEYGGNNYSKILLKIVDKIARNICKRWSKWLPKASFSPRRCASIQVAHCKQNLLSELVDNPPFSSNLAPPDYHLFPKLRRSLKGLKLSSIREVM